MTSCPKCTKITAIGFIVIAVILLGVNVKWWSIAGIEWYTLAILWFGITSFAKGTCKDCQLPSKKK
jgi:hypothetical protein